MADKDVSKAAVVVLLIITFLGGAITIGQIDSLYYCSLENTVQECTSLKDYGVRDAKCVLPSGKGDICTAGGEREAWVPASDYTGVVVPLRTIGVESIQDCVNETYIDYESQRANCTTRACSDVFLQGYNRSTPVERVRAKCEPVGFIITDISGAKIGIRGSCCGYFEEDARVICKQPVRGFCNPVCKQTSPDPDVYDEFCMIYDFRTGYVIPKMVGDTKYTRDNQLVLAEVTRE